MWANRAVFVIPLVCKPMLFLILEAVLWYSECQLDPFLKLFPKFGSSGGTHCFHGLEKNVSPS